MCCWASAAVWGQSSRGIRLADCGAYARGMSAQDLRGVLSEAFNGETIRGLDFSHASLISVSGPKSLWLDRCTFAGADLRHACLDKWHFKLCDLRGANLRGASLRGAWFAGCDLTGADLRDTDLTYASFESIGVGEGATATQLEGVLSDPGALPNLQ